MRVGGALALIVVGLLLYLLLPGILGLIGLILLIVGVVALLLALVGGRL